MLELNNLTKNPKQNNICKWPNLLGFVSQMQVPNGQKRIENPSQFIPQNRKRKLKRNKKLVTYITPNCQHIVKLFNRTKCFSFI